jgi:hypothetical protein
LRNNIAKDLSLLFFSTKEPKEFGPHLEATYQDEDQHYLEVIDLNRLNYEKLEEQNFNCMLEKTGMLEVIGKKYGQKFSSTNFKFTLKDYQLIFEPKPEKTNDEVKQDIYDEVKQDIYDEVKQDIYDEVEQKKKKKKENTNDGVGLTNNYWDVPSLGSTSMGIKQHSQEHYLPPPPSKSSQFQKSYGQQIQGPNGAPSYSPQLYQMPPKLLYGAPSYSPQLYQMSPNQRLYGAPRLIDMEHNEVVDRD